MIHSTTIALPTWHETCRAHRLTVRLLPRDVATRWNSTYDMLVVARKYSTVIDSITADKALKLRKFELSDDQWVIVDDLIFVLNVC